MEIELAFHGAAGTVTGSCFLLSAGDARVLVDCGMFQGSKTERKLNYEPFPFDPAGLDCVLLTHAHIDHAGMLPKLTRGGFDGPIYATRASADLAAVMLPDSARIQEYEVEDLNRRNRRKGRPEVEPVYREEDAERCVGQFRGVDYEEWNDVAPGIRARFWNAGHLVGSASIEVEVTDGGRTVRTLFSGDLGPDYKLLHPDPDAPAGFDYIVCESTYGDEDRFDRTPARRRIRMAKEVHAAIERGGPLLIPSFAVERTQEVVTDLVGMMLSGELPQAKIFIDSPLAAKASQVFIDHASELELGPELLRAFNSDLVRHTQSVDESKALNRLTGFFIVIAASGMCDAGRIRHHLRHRLWKRETTVLMAGYQAHGTLGRILLEGVRNVRIQGRDVSVRATVSSIADYSGHADGPQLAEWLSERFPLNAGLFLVHGEDDARRALRQRAHDIGIDAGRIHQPMIDEVYRLEADGAQLIDRNVRRRMKPDDTARPDWNNDLTALMLDIDEAVQKAGNDKARGVILRRLRRALADE